MFTNPGNETGWRKEEREREWKMALGRLKHSVIRKIKVATGQKKVKTATSHLLELGEYIRTYQAFTAFHGNRLRDQ